ncbi:uroporphyrinogen-III synthase HemD family protein [Collimonas arenae]|uniref:Uroporphyrinogen-III synthase n=1 Tax=Collimonas arenae TaxID=279058 RepID=A0A127PTB3_9BURK|nr:uroporphyrinogen-III synthase [Collimonas arenae]AMP00865.1 uroporphyrinogen-III synthase HemD family protein [Collimonas arenae]AMP10757.1 uroporphyrinogen-III synthase HemD family protein [Collimonas arenae]
MQPDPSLPPIVITRPAAQAAALARQIAARGRQPVIFPLLEILPLDDDTALQAALARLDDYALAVFVSPNAVDAAFRHISQWPSQLPIGIVGEGSRAALARHGLTAQNVTIFNPPDPTRSDSEGLLQALDLAALRGRRVLLVRGESGRELLADALRAADIEVMPIAAYRRRAPRLDTALKAQLQLLLDSRNDWIVTSSEALRHLIDLVRQVENGGDVAKIQQQKLVVPHARIAETAYALGFTDVTLTGSGDERLLDALQFPL